jgi:hypothetical protein
VFVPPIDFLPMAPDKRRQAGGVTRNTMEEAGANYIERYARPVSLASFNAAIAAPLAPAVSPLGMT